MQLKDKVALITGGAGGIGQSTCRMFIAQGAKVVVADLSLEMASNAAKKIDPDSRSVIAKKADVRNFNESERLVEETLTEFGRLDILANVAGGSAGTFIKHKHSLFAESSPERWKEIIDLNLYGTLNCTRAAVNHMIKRRFGKIINLASAAGMIGMQKAAEYSAAKAGIIGFTKALAKEVATYGINVNSVSPGVVGTERVKQMPKESVDSWLEGIPFGRLASSEEIASVILFLASEESRYITGVNIPVTGGQTLGPRGY